MRILIVSTVGLALTIALPMLLVSELSQSIESKLTDTAHNLMLILFVIGFDIHLAARVLSWSLISCSGRAATNAIFPLIWHFAALVLFSFGVIIISSWYLTSSTSATGNVHVLIVRRIQTITIAIAIANDRHSVPASYLLLWIPAVL